MNIYSHQNQYLNNKYTRWYYAIIEEALSQDRKRCKRTDLNFVYYELHHILPSCIFPEYNNLKENPWNSVLLTGKEHFICHLLLPKMVMCKQHQYKMIHALWAMTRNNSRQDRIRISSRRYDQLRRMNAIALSESNMGKLSKNKGKVRSTEVKERIRNKLKGRKYSEERNRKVSEALKGRKKPFSQKRADAIRRAKQNMTIETKNKMSAAKQGREYLFRDDLQQCVHIKKEQVEFYLNDGWVLGRKRFKVKL